MSDRPVVPQNVSMMVIKPKKGGVDAGNDILVNLIHMDRAPPLPEEGKFIRCGQWLYRVTSIMYEYRWYQGSNGHEAITEISIYVEDL